MPLYPTLPPSKWKKTNRREKLFMWSKPKLFPTWECATKDPSLMIGSRTTTKKHFKAFKDLYSSQSWELLQVEALCVRFFFFFLLLIYLSEQSLSVFVGKLLNSLFFGQGSGNIGNGEQMQQFWGKKVLKKNKVKTLGWLFCFLTLVLS